MLSVPPRPALASATSLPATWVFISPCFYFCRRETRLITHSVEGFAPCAWAQPLDSLSTSNFNLRASPAGFHSFLLQGLHTSMRPRLVLSNVCAHVLHWAGSGLWFISCFVWRSICVNPGFCFSFPGAVFLPMVLAPLPLSADPCWANSLGVFQALVSLRGVAIAPPHSAPIMTTLYRQSMNTGVGLMPVFFHALCSAYLVPADILLSYTVSGLWISFTFSTLDNTLWMGHCFFLLAQLGVPSL